MPWPQDTVLGEQHPFLVATTSYVEGTVVYAVNGLA